MKIKDILGHWFVKNVLLAALLIFAFVMVRYRCRIFMV